MVWPSSPPDDADRLSYADATPRPFWLDRPRPEPSTATPEATPPRAQDEPLTDKESRILDLLAQGRSNKQIATAVFLAEGTVKNYVSRIMEKLHASSRYELAVRAVARRP